MESFSNHHNITVSQDSNNNCNYYTNSNIMSFAAKVAGSTVAVLGVSAALGMPQRHERDAFDDKNYRPGHGKKFKTAHPFLTISIIYQKHPTSREHESSKVFKKITKGVSNADNP